MPTRRDRRPALLQPARPALRLERRADFPFHARGSKRVLGVVGGDGDPASPSALTPALRAAMTPPAPGELRPVTADLPRLPLALDRPGRMRPVCLAEATEIAPAPDC